MMAGDDAREIRRLLASLQERMAAVERRMAALEGVAEEAAPSRPPPEATPRPPEREAVPVPPPEHEAPVRPPGERPLPPPPPPPPPPRSREPERQAPGTAAAGPDGARPRQPAPAQATGIDLEELIGGRWALWVGVVLVLFAVAFGLAYAWRYIDPVGRVAIGAILGLAAIAVGEALRDRTGRWFSDGIIACGFGLLYLTTWAAVARHQAVGPGVGLTLMVAIVGWAVWTAVRHDALSLIVLATIGGYLSPWLLREHGAGYAGFWTYLTLLNAGLLAVVSVKRWPQVRGLVLVGTLLSALAWFITGFEPGDRWPVFIFVTVNFLIFVGIGTVQPMRFRVRFGQGDAWFLVGVAVAYFAVGIGLVRPVAPWADALFAAGLAATYALLYLMSRDWAPEDSALPAVSIGLAASFAVIAPSLLVDGNALAMVWAAEGVGLVAGGFAWDIPVLRWLGTVTVSLGATVALAASTQVDVSHAPPLVNARALPLLVMIGALSGAGWYFIRHRDALPRGERGVSGWLCHTAAVVALWTLTQETWLLFGGAGDPKAAQLGVSVAWAVYAAVALAWGISRGARGARWVGLIVLGVAVLKVFIWDLSFLTLPFRMLSFGVLGIILIGVAWAYSRYGDRLRELT